MEKKLVNDWKFSDIGLAQRFARNGVAKALLKLEKEGFKCSEYNPLLIISLDTTDVDSIGYFNEGNYGIAATTAGHLAGPIPATAQQGPRAVGEFLTSFEGVEDKSGGDLTVLYFKSFGLMHSVRDDFVAKRQFYRLGPVMSTRFNVPEEARLVEFFTLDQMNSQPAPYEDFNRSM